MAIRFGTLGAAGITPNALIKPCADEPGAEIIAIAARNRARAEKFAARAGISRVLDSYADVIADPDVDAIYIPLPITAHHEWTIKALKAGKHVLCEKSFASNAAEAAEMAQVAKETGLVCVDAFHTRYHPQFLRAKEIYSSGVLGKIERLEAAFHTSVTDPDNIRMKYETGGGVTMDIGCYPISWVRHLTGEEPAEITAEAETGPPDVDISLQAEFRFPSGITAHVSGDMRAGTEFSSRLEVYGDKGSMSVTNAIMPSLGNGIELRIGDRVTQETFPLRPTYSYQLDAFIDAVENGVAMHTDANDAVKQMKAIDACYQAAGLRLRGL